MRTLLAVLLASFLICDASAQSVERPRPPGTRPLEEAPPPPPLTQLDKAVVDPANEPVVTVRVEGDQRIEEHRIGGRLFMQKVTPKHGKAYVLMDHRGDGTFTRQDSNLDQSLRVPQWVILEF
jgi:hypothetical protein